MNNNTSKKHWAVKLFKTAAFLLFFISGLSVYAQDKGSSGGNPLFTFEFTDTPVKQVFNYIQEHSNYVFLYYGGVIDDTRRVTIKVSRQNIHGVLNQLFKGIPVSYSIQERQIILKREEGQATPKVRSVNVTGLVTDGDGNPVIGATVRVKDTDSGVITDIDGKYMVKANVGQSLVFSYIGYVTEEREIKDDSAINIRMMEASTNLDDVVIVGYGQQKKESVVSSINSVKPAEISIPTANLSNMLAGQVAGVIAIQRSGEPGNDAASFWIRGQSSYMGGTSPLVLVDGVPRDMNDIDVDEIETFTVLKDAAATAVYGAEGANGVVLITSKRGIAQKTRVDVNAQFSIVTPTRLPELMDAYNYLNMYTEAEWNEAGNPGNFLDFTGSYDRALLELYRTGADLDLYPNANWMELLSPHTTNQRYTINFRGGSDRFRFFASGAYYKEDGIFDSQTTEGYNANTGLQRFNLRSNVDMDITRTTQLSIDLSGQYKTLQHAAESSSEIFGSIVTCPTFMIPFYYSDGSLAQLPNAGDQRTNPYNLLNQSGYTKRWTASLQSKVQLQQKLDFITKGLSVRGSVSFDADFTSAMQRTKTPKTVYATGRDELGNLIFQSVTEEGALSDPKKTNTSGEKRIYIEAALDYKRLFGEKHDVNGILVYSQKETQYQNVDGLQLLPYRKQNFVGRLSYGYDGRYMLEGSFGMTGSENFAAGHRWGIFPAVGAAWYVSNEKFVQETNARQWLSKLKLRASYGITGNDNIGASNRFSYREQLNTGGAGYAFNIPVGSSGGNPGSSNGIVESTFAAPALTWEKEKKLNVGIDLGLFDNRIDLSVDYFSNRREDILMTRKIVPGTLGFRVNPWQNFGIVDNKGVDGSIILNHQIGDWKLSARANATYANNKIVEYDEVPAPYDYQNYTGQSIGQPYCFIAEGLYTPDDFNITTGADGGYDYELKESLPQPSTFVKPGDIKYKDLNGDNVIDQYDKTYENGLNPSNPKLVYGFGFNVEYKGFFAGIFFQGTGKTTVNLINNANYFMPFNRGPESGSARMDALSHWSAEDPYNQNVLFPRLHINKFDHNLEYSTWWYRDGSFLRLKNVNLSYSLPKSVLDKMKVSQLKFFLQGNNLCLLQDGVKYYDPENSSIRAYPLMRSYSFGVNLSF